jgi:outer membrane lipoprotein SlyB
MLKQMLMVVSAVVLCGLAGCATGDASGDDGVKTSETSADATECFSPGGLYDAPCGNVREDIPQHAQIDLLGGSASCGGETWLQATHHATGHQGWVRGSSVCP